MKCDSYKYVQKLNIKKLNQIPAILHIDKL